MARFLGSRWCATACPRTARQHGTCLRRLEAPKSCGQAVLLRQGRHLTRCIASSGTHSTYCQQEMLQDTSAVGALATCGRRFYRSEWLDSAMRPDPHRRPNAVPRTVQQRRCYLLKDAGNGREGQGAPPATKDCNDRKARLSLRRLDCRTRSASAAPHRNISSFAAAPPASTPSRTTARCCGTCGPR